MLPLCFALIGAAGLYLASRNQRWLPRALPPIAGWAGGAALVVACVLWIRTMTVPSGVLSLLTVLMAGLTLYPVIGAFARGRNGDQA